MMGSTCPYCGAETRSGDNFCLNCGNRLIPATPSSQQQAQPIVGESTLPAEDGWASSMQDQGSPPPSSGANWSDSAAPTIASSSAEPPTSLGSPAAQSVGQATSTASATIEHPAKFILHADNGDVLQEYVLEKPEISVGRAPNSDILLSKDKLTSRRHATVSYENGKYILHDERSANGTFVNGQQLEEMASHELQDGDHVGIGEHELIFRGFGSSSSTESDNVSEMPTMAVQYNPDQELTYRTQEDDNMTSGAGDDFSTKSMGNGTSEAVQPAVAEAPMPNAPASEEASTPSFPPGHVSASPAFAPAATSSAASNASSPSLAARDIGVTFNSLTNIPQPTLPDIAPLMAALSTLDGQVMSLQEQLNATQEAVRNHETEVAQATSQLRSGVRRVSDRMDSTIADVARSREALSWAELIQLMEDVQNNPRDIEYVTKLARKARELNKVFQLHQNVLNTLAECNSLLRSLIEEDR
ncbi:MAG: FHA domain-containing protein [Chloroflexi bacterium]|nr:MAG: FHA domain-containing protein [Chloroflexota bacterium]